MRIFPDVRRARGLRTLHGCNAERGHMEFGSVFVIVAVLGVITYMGVTDTAWGDLSLLGKGIIVGIIAVAVLAAWIVNQSSQWPSVNLSSSETPPKIDEPKSEEKEES